MSTTNTDRAAQVLQEIDAALALAEKATQGPWTLSRGGGHALPSIRGTESVHTNGKQRNSLGISSASYSEEVCQIFADPDLEGPAANIAVIAASRTLMPASLRCLKTAIEGLLEDVIPYSWKAELLTTLCDQWEAAQ